MSLEHTDAESAAVAVAPRVTLKDIEDAIEAEYIFTGDQLTGDLRLATFTLAIMQMRNGFVVVGSAAPASPENYNAELGRKFAHEDAVRKVWPLMGYSLRDKLSRDSLVGPG
jgi:hypothetical protein